MEPTTNLVVNIRYVYLAAQLMERHAAAECGWNSCNVPVGSNKGIVVSPESAPLSIVHTSNLYLDLELTTRRSEAGVMRHRLTIYSHAYRTERSRL